MKRLIFMSMMFVLFASTSFATERSDFEGYEILDDTNSVESTIAFVNMEIPVLVFAFDNEVIDCDRYEIVGIGIEYSAELEKPPNKSLIEDEDVYPRCRTDDFSMFYPQTKKKN